MSIPAYTLASKLIAAFLHASRRQRCTVGACRLPGDVRPAAQMRPLHTQLNPDAHRWVSARCVSKFSAASTRRRPTAAQAQGRGPAQVLASQCAGAMATPAPKRQKTEPEPALSTGPAEQLSKAMAPSQQIEQAGNGGPPPPVPIQEARVMGPQGHAQPESSVRGGDPATRKKSSKRRGDADPTRAKARELNHAMGQAARHGDLDAALAAFREAQADKAISLPLASFNTLLFLTVGAEKWEVLARGGDPHTCAVRNVNPDAQPTVVPEPAAAATPGATAAEGVQGDRNGGERGESAGAAAPAPAPVDSRLSVEERVAIANEAWAMMQAQGLKPDQASYLALARLEGLQRRPDKAFEWVQACKAAGQPTSLRLFHPALVGYCMNRDTAALARLVDTLAAEDLDLTEYEFARLVEGFGAHRSGSAWPQLQGVLGRMRRELEGLAPTTLDLLEAYFTSPQACHALPQPPGHATPAQPDSQTTPSPATWRLQTVQVAANGWCEEAGGQLQVVDLEEQEWEAFAQGVASLAQKNESNKTDFSTYMQWYDKHGPYDILIDGANVAFFGQNREGGGFSWPQIKRMVEAVKAAHPHSRVLLMLHRRRVADRDAQEPWVKDFLAQLRKQQAFYATPHGSNDDWYWMYATVRSRHKGLLVSNDELRDHIFSLLRPKHFLKWKARHIVHYTFNGVPGAAPSLQYPPAFTSCTQQLSSGAWMFPAATGEGWLCARPT